MKPIYIAIPLILLGYAFINAGDLKGTSWAYISGYDKEREKLITFPCGIMNKKQTLSFADSVYITGVCNIARDEYMIKKDSIISLKAWGATKMGCGEGNRVEVLMREIGRSKYHIKGDTLFIDAKHVSFKLLKN